MDRCGAASCICNNEKKKNIFAVSIAACCTIDSETQFEASQCILLHLTINCTDSYQYNRMEINNCLNIFPSFKVLPDGTYVKPPQSKLAYSTLVQGRVMYVAVCADRLAMACTIATRYSAVRRQGEMKPG